MSHFPKHCLTFGPDLQSLVNNKSCGNGDVTQTNETTEIIYDEHLYPIIFSKKRGLLYNPHTSPRVFRLKHALFKYGRTLSLQECFWGLLHNVRGIQGFVWFGDPTQACCKWLGDKILLFHLWKKLFHEKNNRRVCLPPPSPPVVFPITANNSITAPG